MSLVKTHTRFCLLTLLTGPLLFSACLDQAYTIGSYKSPVASASPSVPNGTNSNPGLDSHTAITFRTLQPALAVRGASCLMCHAQVNSNVITDFGSGDSYFLEKDRAGASGMYFDWGTGQTAWMTSAIHGSLVVPKVDLDHSFSIVDSVDPKHAKGSMSLAEAIQLPFLDANNQVTQASLVSSISPPAGSVAVIEKKRVYIGAPLETEILAMAPQLTSPGFAAVPVVGITPDSALPLSGLQIVNGSSGVYVSNSSTEPFVCAGDVMIRGTLFLNSLNLKTNDGGCRLYVSGSVFVQGPIKYIAQNLVSANLQITSASLIALGFSANTLKSRLALSGGGYEWLIDYFKTRSSVAPKVRHTAFLAEATAIGGMVDAGAIGDASAKNTFAGLLLNAPEVHSRYVGPFTGAVIAEIGMFRLSDFVFSFDPIFKKVPILPALKSDILSIED